MQLKLLYSHSENTTFPVKQLNQMSGLRERRRDERITEMCTMTIVKFHDSPILQLPRCSLYQ